MNKKIFTFHFQVDAFARAETEEEAGKLAMAVLRDRNETKCVLSNATVFDIMVINYQIDRDGIYEEEDFITRFGEKYR